jgi:hypothetical protein
MLEGNSTWDAECSLWNDCGRVWNCLGEILAQQGGGMEEYDWIQRYSLKNKDKDRIISLYVEIFKDHLTDEEKSLLETAGIRLTYVDKAEINEAVSVIVKAKSIYTESLETSEIIENDNYDSPKVSEMKTVSLQELMNILKVK